MGVDLSGRGGSFSCNWSYWRSCLDIAVAFGWDPAGTIAGADLPEGGEWDGGYFTNGFQLVTDEDAKSIPPLSHAMGAAADQLHVASVLAHAMWASTPRRLRGGRPASRRSRCVKQ
jgi:hypothetical protein